MTLALGLVSDSKLQDAVSAQLAPLTVDFSCAFDAEDFWDMLPKRPFEAMLAELAALDVAPTTFLCKARRIHPNARVLFLGLPEDDSALPAGRATVLRLPLAEGALARALARTVEEPSPTDPLEDLVGPSAALVALKDRVRLFAAVDSTVLIVGESGVGKEKIARALHALSARRDGPFVAVNCGAIPSEIIESELFGHIKGAFTGADRDRTGQLPMADRGTLFLDEIATMRLDHQVRLLRVLQDRQVTPVGATVSTPVDVRVVAATNGDLMSLIETGRFREDLFYRLNVLLVSVAPLRERREDIPELARWFVRRFAARHGMREKTISELAMERLLSHPWKGNVRELENAIEHAMVLARGRPVIELLDLPWGIGDRRSGLDRSAVRLTPAGIDLNDTVSRLERDMILQSLALTGGNKSKAAELLRLKRTTFVEKMRRLELLDEEDSPLNA